MRLCAFLTKHESKSGLVARILLSQGSLASLAHPSKAAWVGNANTMCSLALNAVITSVLLLISPVRLPSFLYLSIRFATLSGRPNCAERSEIVRIFNGEQVSFVVARIYFSSPQSSLASLVHLAPAQARRLVAAVQEEHPLGRRHERLYERNNVGEPHRPVRKIEVDPARARGPRRAELRHNAPARQNPGVNQIVKFLTWRSVTIYNTIVAINGIAFAIGSLLPEHIITPGAFLTMDITFDLAIVYMNTIFIYYDNRDSARSMVTMAATAIPLVMALSYLEETYYRAIHFKLGKEFHKAIFHDEEAVAKREGKYGERALMKTSILAMNSAKWLQYVHY